MLIALAAILLAPLIGGLLRGLDRILTARMQGRVGPPLLQPFYDLVKLFSKSTIITGRVQMVAAWGYLLFIIAAAVMLALRQDLLLLFLVLGAGDVFLVTGAFASRSPYSRIGANRELLQVLAYEPVLILASIAVYLKTGSFLISAVSGPLLPSLWPVYLALVITLVILMRKSPFDISASEHAHQEIVRGPFTEYSGLYLGLIELAHWYELVVMLAVLALFWAVWPGVALALLSWLAVLFIDNITARLNWSTMIRLTWAGGLGLGTVNIIALKVLGG